MLAEEDKVVTLVVLVVLGEAVENEESASIELLEELLPDAVVAVVVMVVVEAVEVLVRVLVRVELLPSVSRSSRMGSSSTYWVCRSKSRTTRGRP